MWWAVFIAGFLGYQAFQRSFDQDKKWRSVRGYLNKYPKNPYFPVETGFLDNLFSRIPQNNFWRGKRVIGDVSPLNPIPFAAVVPERKNLNMTQWGFAYVEPEKQVELIDEIYNKEEHWRFDQSERIPKGKKRWRLENTK